MVLAYAMLAAQAENPHFSPYPVSNKPEPEWKRKKCKSCKDWHWCRNNPNSQACDQYTKRKR